MRAWIQTIDGEIDYVDPRPEQINLRTIAVSLARQPRYSGMVPEGFDEVQWGYSIAQHSVLVADDIEQRSRSGEIPYHMPVSARMWQRLALLHDAAEAYIGDMPGPLKRLVGEPFRAVERRVEAAIRAHFGLTKLNPDERRIIKQSDQAVLLAERLQLVPRRNTDKWWQHWREIYGDEMPAERGIAIDRVWTPREAASRFTRRAKTLGLRDAG